MSGNPRTATEPLVSVVTVVRNGEREIARTLESICALKEADVEIIVVDGASTDATMTVLQRFAADIDTLVSEPDSGIYDAMNKGIGLAHGRFVVHINVGDRLLRIPRTELLAAAGPVAALSFPVQLTTGSLHVPRMDWRMRVRNALHHQGTFYRRAPELRYDTRWRTFADFDLNTKMAAERVSCLPAVVAEHADDGVSHQPARFGEIYAVVRANHGPAWVMVCWLYFKVRGLRWRLKRLFRS